MNKHSPQSILYTLALMVGCAALFSFIYLIPGIYNYMSLTSSFPIEVDQIEILELGENFYVPKAIFQYQGNERVELLDSLAEDNPYSLADTMKTWSQNVIGYTADGKSCTLQKCFPVKQLIYTFILGALTLYFYFLGKKASI